MIWLAAGLKWKDQFWSGVRMRPNVIPVDQLSCPCFQANQATAYGVGDIPDFRIYPGKRFSAPRQQTMAGSRGDFADPVSLVPHAPDAHSAVAGSAAAPRPARRRRHGCLESTLPCRLQIHTQNAGQEQSARRAQAPAARTPTYEYVRDVIVIRVGSAGRGPSRQSLARAIKHTPVDTGLLSSSLSLLY
eukprot:3473571-Pleurochrysis_carterae.AAC.3